MNQDSKGKKNNFGVEPSFPKRSPAAPEPQPPTQPPQQPSPPPLYSDPNLGDGRPKEPSKSALWSMILAVAAAVCTFIPFINLLVLPMMITAFVLALVGLKDVKKRGKTGRGQALAGLIISIVWFAIILLLLIFFGVALFLGFFNKPAEDRYAIVLQTELQNGLEESGNTKLPRHQDLFADRGDFWRDVSTVSKAYEDIEFKDVVPEQALATESFYAGYYAESAPIDSQDALPNKDNIHIWVGYHCQSDVLQGSRVGGRMHYDPTELTKEKSNITYAMVYKISSQEDLEDPWRCRSSLIDSFF